MARLSWLTVAVSSLVTLLTIVSTTRCQTVLSPFKLVDGINNNLLLISESDSQAQLHLSDKTTGEVFHRDKIHFKEGQLVEWPLSLADNKLANKESVTLTIKFENGFESTEDLDVLSTNGFVFFQTDKPIYRVSEKVRFRILRLAADLSPLNETVLLRIKNHQGIKVEEVLLQTSPPMHVAEYSFNFPLISKPGKWQAEILYGANRQSTQSTFFEVTEYVLPMFKIDIDMPKYILGDEQQANITLRAFYLFGKPVKGTVYFKFGIELNTGFKLLSTSSTFCFDQGGFSYSHNVNFTKFLLNQNFIPFVVQAIVRDCGTGSLESTESKRTLIVHSPYKISLRNAILKYKPNMINFLTFEVLDPHDEPVANVPIKIKLTDKKSQEIQLPYIISSGNSDQWNTDNNGRVVITYKLENIGIISGHISTIDDRFKSEQQAEINFKLEPFDSNEEAYVVIRIIGRSPHKLSYTSGEHFQGEIESKGDLKSFYLVVTSKGAIIHKQKLSQPKFDFSFTNRMVPSVRVLVLGIKPDGSAVADSLRLHVHQSNCAVKVNPQTDSSTIRPGANFTFVLQGEPGSVVGFQAIDEAVYSLKNEKNASLSQYQNTLAKSDLGCDAGSGKNSLEVVRNAGLKILSSLGDSSRKYSKGCRFNKLTRKRQVRQVESDKQMRQNKKRLLEYCCNLGKQATKQRRSCEEKSKVVAQELKDEDCAEEFLKCCQQKGLSFQASVAVTSSISPIANLEKSKTTPTYTEKTEELNVVRKDFRDTWLFDLVLLNQSTQEYTTVSPHSITSWFISSLSVSQVDGFCINHDYKVTTYKPFFIKVSFPPTIIEHEQTEITVTIFNYEKKRDFIIATVTFHRVKNICADWTNNEVIRKSKKVLKMSSNQIKFPIVPLYAGEYQIEIEAGCNQEMCTNDRVIKNLTVLAPGVEQSKQLNFDLDPLNRAKRAPKVESDYFLDETVPSNEYQRTKVMLKMNNDRKSNQLMADLNIVPKTLHYVVTALGERFSPQVESIDKLNELLQKPKGCGEQNMYYMSFNLYTVMYLDKRGRLSANNKTRAIRMLKSALARQLNFRKADGSYSAFYKRPPSVWLTGFVSKVLCQAAPYLGTNLEPEIIDQTLKWLIEQQSSDGSWIEQNVLLHEKALGGVKGVTGLTAYLIIALNECQHYLSSTQNKQEQRTLMMSINRANAYLEKLNLQQINDAYQQALVAYSLSFGNTIKTQTLVDRLLQSSKEIPKLNQLYWDSDYPTETASYALMAILKTKPDIFEYISIVNWLSAQEKRGTFDNTQDTIVALEALYKFYTIYNDQLDKQLHLNTNVSFNARLKRSLHFHSANADILQTIPVDNGTKEISFETRGNGLGKVSVLIIYNEYNPNGTCKFDLNVTVTHYTPPVDVDFSKPHFIDDWFDTKTVDSMTKLEKKLQVKKTSLLRNRQLEVSSSSPEFVLPNCCFLPNSRNKRSIFYTRNFWAPFAEKVSTNGRHFKKRSQHGQSNASNDYRVKLPPLPNLGIDNPVIRLLNICVRHLEEYSNDMAILEVSILSGYTPVEVDLRFLSQNSSYISQYEIDKSKVNFYFKEVPHSRMYCFQFRIFQEHNVEHIQSALVRIYNYYGQAALEWSCTRLYSDIGIQDYFSVNCTNEQRCRCVTNKKCPNNEQLKGVISYDQKEIDGFANARKAFKNLVCQYSHVAFAKIIDKTKRNVDTYKSPMLTLEPIEILRGDFDKKLTVRFNPQCSLFANFPLNVTVLIMHKVDNEFTNSVWLLDGESVLYQKDDSMLPVYHYFRISEPTDCD